MELTNLTQYLAFIISNIVFYQMYYITAENLEWEMSKKGNTRHYENITNLILLSSVLASYSNFAARWDLLMFITTAISMFGFGLLAELPFLKTNISPEAIKGWKIGTKLFFIAVLLIIVYFAFYHFYEAGKQGEFSSYLSAFILIMYLAFGIPYDFYTEAKKKGQYIPFHPHHYLIFFILALFTKYDTIVSKITGSICLGIFIQGSAMYGNQGFMASTMTN